MTASNTPKNKFAAGAPRDASRRAFVGTLTSAVAVGFALQIFGCIEEDPVSSVPAKPDGNGTCALGKAATADRSGTVASNHGHVALVTGTQQDTGTAFNLSIQGSAGHNHTLALTTQNLADLKAGLALTKTSSTDAGHSHSVTFAATTSIWRPGC
jgi:hypothetical protein